MKFLIVVYLTVLKILLFVIFTVVLSPVWAAAMTDQSQSWIWQKQKSDVNLFHVYQDEINQLSQHDLDTLNQQVLTYVQSDQNRPADMNYRKYYSPVDQFQKIMNVVKYHPVVGLDVEKYERGSSSLGYCFGRATYLHLLFLKMGLQKNSIQKIWVLGRILNDRGNGYWQFHVATMVYTQFQGWVVLDVNIGKPLSVPDWILFYLKNNLNEKIRFYITDANKFGPSVGRYDRVQLGLDSTREMDWYNHYFKDMIYSFKRESLEQLGLVHF